MKTAVMRKLLLLILVPTFCFIRRRFHSFSPKLESTYYYFNKFPKINRNSRKPHVSAPLWKTLDLGGYMGGQNRFPPPKTRLARVKKILVLAMEKQHLS